MRFTDYNPSISVTTFGISLQLFLPLPMSGRRRRVRSLGHLFQRFQTLSPLILLLTIQIFSRCSLQSKLMFLKPSLRTILILSLSSRCATVFEKVSGLGLILPNTVTLTHMTSLAPCLPTKSMQRLFVHNASKNGRRVIIPDLLVRTFFRECTPCRFMLFPNLTPATFVSSRTTVLAVSLLTAWLITQRLLVSPWTTCATWERCCSMFGARLATSHSLFGSLTSRTPIGISLSAPFGKSSRLSLLTLSVLSTATSVLGTVLLLASSFLLTVSWLGLQNTSN